MDLDKKTSPDATVLRRRAWIAGVQALSPVDAAYDVVATIHHDRNQRLRRNAGS